jgi:regulator of sigma E protease
VEILGSAFWFLVAVGILVSFHEFGHFIVARWMGVKVLRFSVGFGRVLWSRRDASGTEYALSAIPLGGYVKMLDEREGEVAPADLDQAFNRKSLGARSAIVAAGPIFNLVFAVAAFWAMYMVGINDFRPVLGVTSGTAASAGFSEGEELVAIADDDVRNWSQVLLALVPRIYQETQVAITVTRPDGAQAIRQLPLRDSSGEPLDEARVLDQLGLNPWFRDPPVQVASLVENGAASGAGLVPGDRIVAVGDEATPVYSDFSRALQAQAAANEGALRLTIERNGSQRQIDLVAQYQALTAERSAWVIGIMLERYTTMARFGVLESFSKGAQETVRITSGSLSMLYHMVAGRASLDNLSGPITIAQVANVSARNGLSEFLNFLGLISLSLAIVNLLPIPILDGGHLLYYFIEWVKGSPLSEQGQTVGLYIGLAMIMGLMGLAFFNDIARLVS